MVIHFYIKYKTQFGQSLSITLNKASDTTDNKNIDIALNYLNDEYWSGSFDAAGIEKKEIFNYKYILREEGKPDKTDSIVRSIHLKKLHVASLNVYDDWQEGIPEEKAFNTKPFLQVFSQHKIKEVSVKKPIHIFEASCSQLPNNKILCLCGSGKKLNNWDLEKPVLLKKKKTGWTVKLNLAKENFPIEYKFGLYDIKQKKAVFLEPGNNRILVMQPDKNSLNIIHQFVSFPGYSWKAAGVNIQLSALKSETSWGVGDFTDLNLLTDWAVQTGIRLIQLLPINDTTATHDRKDSYPYSAVSAFALHPLFLNVQKLAVSASLEFSDELLKKIKEINELPEVDYESVALIKTAAIKALYKKAKLSFKDDFAYFDFFDLNRHWLVPYAVFCYLRDRYNTPDSTQWEQYSKYNEDLAEELAGTESGHYDEIAIHYFTQYHLHLQLLDAVEYAHKKEVILKGDLPIGVARNSVDTWMHPHLFHMDIQAGAPPDAFTVKGQNWGFPTYNWELMQHDDYAWWRQRMEHMSNYFDAIRIDHVLGFFRIWSIPMYAVEGIFGRFMPAYPLGIHDFENAGLHFNERRFCDPYFTNDILDQSFGDDAGWIKENVMEEGRLKENFNTQQKIAAYFNNYPQHKKLQQKLFALLGNFILLRDEELPGHYHFRISIQDTTSFTHLPAHEQQILNDLYRKYFFENQNDLWFKEAQGKLDAIQKGTSMLICAEDLGMVPPMVEDVLKKRQILSLRVQRMPKTSQETFSHPASAPYLSVVTPSTHDMSTLREWWEEDPTTTQSFYNYFPGHYGTAPFYCEPLVAKDIVLQHLQSPAMLCVFLLQDLFAINGNIRRENPKEERINIPADPDHYWNYRMHITLNFLLQQKAFSDELHSMIKESGR